jgi:Icc-related predicted phosphoesterase
LKFVAISDTHGQHEKLLLPKGDVLIHAGDISMRGDEASIKEFLHWFSHQNYQYKILIAGNHDFYFERASTGQIEKIIPEGVIYLNDTGITINNIKFWGSPITPWFFDWAFNRYRGEQIKRHWDLIPNDTDILITHGPVSGILDSTKKGEHVGCEDLLNRVNKIKPRVHLCGHIHEAYGTVEKKGIKYINASVLNERYELTNNPVIFEL